MYTTCYIDSKLNVQEERRYQTQYVNSRLVKLIFSTYFFYNYTQLVTHYTDCYRYYYYYCTVVTVIIKCL